MAHVLVVGAGALGGLLAALLREADHDARLVVQPQQAVALRHGVRVDGGAYGEPRDVAVPASTRAPPGFRPDLVVMAVKTQDLEAALADHARDFGDAPVVALQNGLAQDEMVTRVVGAARAVAAIASIDATHLEPGVVECVRKGRFTVGAPHPDARGAAEAARAVLGSAVETAWTDDARGARWTKLVVNLANAIPALTGLPFQETSSHPRLGVAHVRLITEGLAVARAEGVKLAPLPWTSPARIAAIRFLPEAVAKRRYAAFVASVLGDTPYYGSTWQSAQRGRLTETHWLNGEIVRRGIAAGVPTPVNDAATTYVAKGERVPPEIAAKLLLGD